jgi:hypothetical protein
MGSEQCRITRGNGWLRHARTKILAVARYNFITIGTLITISPGAALLGSWRPFGR